MWATPKLAAWAWVLGLAAAARGGWVTVALTGQARPGDPGSTYTVFDTPMINAGGKIAFTGHTRVSSPGIFVYDSAGLAPLVLSGASIPGPEAGSILYTPTLVQWNNNGVAAFRFSYYKGTTGTQVTSYGVTTPTGPQYVMRIGDDAAGVPSRKYLLFSSTDPSVVALGDDDKLTFACSVTTSLTGLWSGTPSNVSFVTGLDQSPPGTTDDWGSFGYARVNAAGTIVFNANMYNTSAGNYNNEGIWYGTPGNIQPLAIEGQPAQGIAGKQYANSPKCTSLTRQGRVAFTGAVTNQGSWLAGYLEAVWTGTPQNLSIPIKRDDPIPAIGAGATVQYLGTPLINDSGDLLLQVTARGTGITSDNDQALILRHGGADRVLAREAAPAPGIPGAVFAKGLYLSYTTTTGGTNMWEATYLNSAGQVLFGRDVTGSGMPASNSQGVWATDLDGTLQLLAYSGQSFLVAPNDWRTIKAIRMGYASNGQDGRATMLSELGDVALRLEFADGTEGLFATRVPFPGDADGDGSALYSDFLAIQSHFNQAGGRGEGDLNGDGWVGSDDFFLFYHRFGQGFGGTQAIPADQQAAVDAFAATAPEPGAALAAALLTLAATTRRRKRAG